nr:phosphatidylethanolamine N-methyltransferase family protein [Arthrobacter roseus]
MTKVGRRLVPALLAGTLGCAAIGVLRRMEREYDSTDTLSSTTVAVMYATYGAHGAALAWACVGRVWPVPCPTRPSRIVGSSLAIGGGAATLAGASPFGVGKQISGIAPGSLHMAGVYRYSRNPQYLGLVLAATGAAIGFRCAARRRLTGGLSSLDSHRGTPPCPNLRHRVHHVSSRHRALDRLTKNQLIHRGS